MYECEREKKNQQQHIEETQKKMSKVSALDWIEKEKQHH